MPWYKAYLQQLKRLDLISKLLDMSTCDIFVMLKVIFYFLIIIKNSVNHPEIAFL